METYSIKQGDEETVEQLDVHLINILLKYDYPQNQLDGFDVEVLWNTTNTLTLSSMYKNNP